MTTIKLKRAYDPVSPDDGYRIYIDWLWPRGLSHETFHYDLWEKGIAPSNTLREWFHQDREGRETEFKSKYENELKSNAAWLPFVDTVRKHRTVTLLYSSRDRNDNNAAVVAEMLTQTLKQ